MEIYYIHVYILCKSVAMWVTTCVGDLWESTHEVLAKTFSHDKGPQFQDQCERCVTNVFTHMCTHTHIH